MTFRHPSGVSDHVTNLGRRDAASGRFFSSRFLRHALPVAGASLIRSNKCRFQGNKPGPRRHDFGINPCCKWGPGSPASLVHPRSFSLFLSFSRSLRSLASIAMVYHTRNRVRNDTPTPGSAFHELIVLPTFAPQLARPYRVPGTDTVYNTEFANQTQGISVWLAPLC